MENLENKNQENLEEKNAENTNKKTSKPKISLVRILVALLIVLSFVGGFFTRHFIESDNVKTSTEIISIIEKYAYIVDKDGNLIDLNEKDYANALLSGLNDRYARYYTKEEYQKNKSQQKGNYIGFGISLDFEGEYPEVSSVVGNSPADKEGFQAGDMLISAKVGETKVQLNLIDASKYLNGIGENTEVEFEILRDGHTLYKTIAKSSYKATYVKYYDSESSALYNFESAKYERKEGGKIDVASDTALIELNGFESDVDDQLDQALEFMKENNRTKLILDLRNNPGGYMDKLTAVSRRLIYNGGQKAIIAIAKNKTGSENYYMNAPILRDNIIDVVVLANKNSASAAECLIGAMLHYGEKNFSGHRLIIETDGKGSQTTFGKGIMQTTYLLTNGGAFKLTTARIFWPDNETCIHGKGIGPDIVPEENVVAKTDVIARARELLS